MNKSLELESGNLRAHLLLAELYLRDGDADRARRQVDAALKVDPQSYPAQMLLGNICLEQKKYGEAQVKIWRRAYATPPPPLTPDDERHPGKDPRYASLTRDLLPLTESLKDTVARFLPYWHDAIVPDLKAGKRVLIAAHGNSLRALVKYLDNIPDADIVGLNIPTGIPLVYELTDELKPVRSYYLGDPEAVKKAAEAVAAQLKRSV